VVDLHGLRPERSKAESKDSHRFLNTKAPSFQLYFCREEAQKQIGKGLNPNLSAKHTADLSGPTTNHQLLIFFLCPFDYAQGRLFVAIYILNFPKLIK